MAADRVDQAKGNVQENERSRKTAGFPVPVKYRHGKCGIKWLRFTAQLPCPSILHPAGCCAPSERVKEDGPRLASQHHHLAQFHYNISTLKGGY